MDVSGTTCLIRKHFLMFTKKPTTRHDWNIHPMPDGAERLDWQRRFSAEEYRLLRLGYTPGAPSDDWFAFFEGETFFIHWKHSGQCVCSIQLNAAASGYQIVDARVNRGALPGLLSGKQSKIIHLLNDNLSELLRWIERTERPARREDWRNTSMPEKKARLDINIIITATQYEKLRWGFIPRVMEDHWFYFMEDNWLHLHRSWTGYCIFQIRLEPDNGGYKATEALVNRDPTQHKSNDENDRSWIRVFLRGDPSSIQNFFG